MATTNELLDRFVELFNSDRFEEAEQDFAPGGVGEEIARSTHYIDVAGMMAQLGVVPGAAAGR